MVDSRESRLPKWVQDELNTLRGRAVGAEKIVQELAGDSPPTTNTVADPYAEHMGRKPIPLPSGVTVQFAMEAERLPALGSYRDEWVNVRVVSGGRKLPHLEINGGKWFSIRPKSSNSVEIYFEAD